MKLIIAQPALTLRGGAERVVLKIAQHYDAKVYVAEYDRKNTFPEFEDVDIEIIRGGVAKGILPYGRVAQGLDYGFSFLNKVIKEDYDVVNPHSGPSNWISRHNRRVLWYCHTPLRDVYDLYQYRLSMKKFYQRPVSMLGAYAVRMIDRDAVKRTECIVANSKNTKSRVEKYFGREDVQVIYPGIDAKKYSDKGEEKYFLYPSRMSPNKRQDYAIRAFETFKRITGRKDYKLILVGVVSKDRFYGSYYDRVVELAKKVGDVKILEEIEDSDLIALYSKATAVLYTPMNEDFGIVPLEAMASFKPIISVNEGGPVQTILNKKTGFLVNSEEEMASRMRYVIEHPSVAKTMGKCGRERVETDYTWDCFFKKFDAAARKVSVM